MTPRFYKWVHLPFFLLKRFMMRINQIDVQFNFISYKNIKYWSWKECWPTPFVNYFNCKVFLNFLDVYKQYSEISWRTMGKRINISIQYYEWHSRQEQYIKWNFPKLLNILVFFLLYIFSLYLLANLEGRRMTFPWTVR